MPLWKRTPEMQPGHSVNATMVTAATTKVIKPDLAQQSIGSARHAALEVAPFGGAPAELASV